MRYISDDLNISLSIIMVELLIIIMILAFK